MITDTLISQIRSLETQLATLKAELRQLNSSRKSLADYYGALKGKVQTSDEEIETAKLKAKTEPA